MFKKLSITLGILFLGFVTVAYATGFTLTSSTVKPNSTLSPNQLFNGSGCSGKNVSPQLSWSGAPKGARSFAVTVFDPDAPGSGWWHWVVYNIPANVTQLLEGAGEPGGARLPAGAIQGRNDFGTPGYGGACPPKGDKPHRYIFTVHALKVEKLDVPGDASAATVGRLIKTNGIGSAGFTAKYGR